MQTTVLDERLRGDRLRLFDVGARGGVDPRWRRYHRFLDVTGFEPEPQECERLNREAPSLAYPSRFLPFALGREAEDGVPFHVANWDVASSIYPPNLDYLRPFPDASKLLGTKEERPISTVTLDQVCSTEGVSPDCLKLDVEGAELDVLVGAQAALSETLAIELEVEFGPLRIGQPLFAEIDAHLRGRGWFLLGLRRLYWRREAGRDPRVRGSGGQLVQGDALYLHQGVLDPDLPLNRGLKLLLILAAYRQLDFVLELLRTSSSISLSLSAQQRAELEVALVPRSSRLLRLIGRGLERFDGRLPRGFDRALEPGDSKVWQDPEFY